MGREVVRAFEAGMTWGGELVRKRPTSSLLVMAGKLSVQFDKFVYSRTNQLLIDGSIVAVALWVAYMIRFDGNLPDSYQRQFVILLPFAVSLYVASNYIAGLYNLVWRGPGGHNVDRVSVSCFGPASNTLGRTTHPPLLYVFGLCRRSVDAAGPSPAGRGPEAERRSADYGQAAALNRSR